MKKISIILLIFFFIPLFVSGGEDNYLFENKEICMLCLDEIAGKKNTEENVCYACKGRYGDKPDNKYFVLMNTEKILKEKLDFESINDGNNKHYSSKQALILKEEKGMNEESIRKLCPDTYNKYKKKNGGTVP